MASLKDTDLALKILNEYNGVNPYILILKRDFFVTKLKKELNDFEIEYIIKNHNKQPIYINKITKLADWYGLKKKEEWNTDFIPEKIKVITLYGETKTHYHCQVQYRQSVNPVGCFLPKKAVLKNFLLEDYHNLYVDFDRYDKLSMSKNPNRKLKPHQKEAVQFLLSRKKCVLADDQGYGKMEPVSSLIPTPNGFKKMGDINEGDVIFSSNGTPCKVLKTFPHTNKEIYRVSFNDNTFVDCGLDHLWVVRDSNMRMRKKGWKVMSLKEIVDSKIVYNNESRRKQGYKDRYKYEIPVTQAVEYSKKEYFIHPYILGYCIGDACLCNGSISISIPDLERENAERIEKFLNDGFYLKEDRYSNCPRYRILENVRHYRNPYKTEFTRLGLNVKSNKKFIPEEYKYGSIEQRYDLLRGLMDSDGTIQNGNKISFSTTSEALAKDVIELVYSLGGIAKLRSCDRKNEGKNIEYYVSMQIKENPFYLKRKADKYNPSFKKYCTKYISSVEYIRNEDAKCLMVDSNDKTYLTSKNYVVTHNTTELIVAAIEGNFDSIVIICPASIKSTWKDELLWYVPERDITIVEGIQGKNKNDLERYLGYTVGKSGKKVTELQAEAKERGKWVDNRFTIVNYDILDEFYQIPKGRSAKSIEEAYNNSPLLQYIKNKKTLIIVDEAHKLSNNGSIRYKVIKDLIKRGNPDSIYAATGTPITNNPKNFFYVLDLLEDPITDDYQYYLDRYCAAFKVPAKGEKDRWTGYFLRKKKKTNVNELTFNEQQELKQYIKDNARMITVANGESNLEELRDRTQHIYLRRVKEDLKGMVNKTIHEIYYDLTPSQQKEYDKLWDEYETAQKEESPDKELNKELIEGGIYKRYLSNQMVPNTIKLVDKLLKTGEKVIIACCYDEELYTLQEYYGTKCVIYNGKLNPKQKDFNKNEFINNPEIKVFLANITAAGVGLTLTVSTKMVFSSFQYTYSDNLQMEDRIHRINQTKDVDIYYQIFNNTQYQRVWDIVLKKQMITNAVIKTEKEK